VSPLANPLGATYLAQLSDADLALLASTESELRARPDAPQQLRAHPDLALDLLGRRTSFEALMRTVESDEPIALVSPFLLFAICVHRCADELTGANYVTEWFGPRQRTPVFDVVDLRVFLADETLRLFLVELLASYTHVSSGSVVVRTPRGLRRQRFSELDPIRLAGLLDVVPPADRAGIYRRLGDLALFLTGVFPDHTALAGLSQVDLARLLRAGGARPRTDLDLGTGGVVTLFDRLGPRWYRLAAEHEAEVGHRDQVLSELSRHFTVARRILNVITDSFLFPFRTRIFGAGA
jgi:hypothetical protein